MTDRFQDKFDREDGEVGANYTPVCGNVVISDEAVIPIDSDSVQSGLSPIFGAGVTAQKTQLMLTGSTMDGPHYVVRAVWAHDDAVGSDDALGGGVTSEPSFTILARMTKDPLLYDLGTDEDPLCYDQGYGARVTFPLDGTAPILKIIKFSPRKRAPNQARPTSIEVDGAEVLASVTLDTDDLNLDPSFDSDNYVEGVSTLPYKGFWQDMRLRIRRADNEVILEVYLNDRNLNTTKIELVDVQDPLWGAPGVPGIEFLSATLANQPTGSSPFALSGMSLLRCGLFSCETFKEIRRPVNVTPSSFYTYSEVVNRVLTLVEKDGDAQYNATSNGQTKMTTYLAFVIEAEQAIIRKEGYFDWLKTSSRIYLKDGQETYDLPINFSEMIQIRPGNWNSPPMDELEQTLFRDRLGGAERTGGAPRQFTREGVGPNLVPTITMSPIPSVSDINTSGREAATDPFVIVEYFGQVIRPLEPDVEIPFVPQADMDVLIYGAAAHALILDTDPNNAQAMGAIFKGKLKDLRRKNNREVSHQTVFRTRNDVKTHDRRHRTPELRSSQLGGYFN